jgi:hypothetical protein
MCKYQQKYIEYKNKYLNLKKQIGGECNTEQQLNDVNLITFDDLRDVGPNERISIKGKCYNIVSLLGWLSMNTNKIIPHLNISINSYDLYFDKIRLEELCKQLFPEELFPLDRLIRRIKDIKTGGIRFSNRTPSYIRNNKYLGLYALEYDYKQFPYVSDELRDNEKIVLDVIKEFPYLFRYASDRLRQDKDTVWTAIKTHGAVFQTIADEFKENRDIVLTAVKTYGMALQYVLPKFKADYEIVLNAIKQNGYALIHASDKFQNDRDMALIAVQTSGDALEILLPKFRSDYEIVRASNEALASVEVSTSRIRSN